MKDVKETECERCARLEADNADLKRRLAEAQTPEVRMYAKVAKERDEALAKLRRGRDRRNQLEDQRDQALAKLAAYKAIDEKAKPEALALIAKMEQEYDEARAETAAMRSLSAPFAKCHNRGFAGECGSCSGCKLKQALSQPGPGAALLERVRKLEAVAEAAKPVAETFRPFYDEVEKPLVDALAALEEKP